MYESWISYLHVFFFPFKDIPQLRLCATWPCRAAGDNNNITINSAHKSSTSLPEPLSCAVLQCYCCNPANLRGLHGQVAHKHNLGTSWKCIFKRYLTTKAVHVIHGNQRPKYEFTACVCAVNSIERVTVTLSFKCESSSESGKSRKHGNVNHLNFYDYCIYTLAAARS